MQLPNICVIALEQIQRAVQVDFFAHIELVLGLGHVVKQKFQDDGAAEAAAFDFEVPESRGRVHVPDVVNSDESRVFHRVGESVAPLGGGRNANVVFAVFAEALAAYVLVAGLAVVTAEPAAFIAQELDLLLLHVRKRAQFVNLPVESKIRNNVTEFVAVQLGDKRPEVRNHLRGGRYEIESGVLRLDVIEQKVRVNDDACAAPALIMAGAVQTCTVSSAVPSIDKPSIHALEHPAQLVTLCIGEVLFANQGIAEGEPCRNPVFLHECHNLFRFGIPETDTPAAPDAVAGRPVNGADFTPVVKVFPVVAP